MIMVLLAPLALAFAAELLDQLSPGRGRRRRRLPTVLTARSLKVPFPARAAIFIAHVVIASGSFAVAKAAIPHITHNMNSMMNMMMGPGSCAWIGVDSPMTMMVGAWPSGLRASAAK